MIDNFATLREKLTFTEDRSEFYFLQIVKRSKDNPSMYRYLEVIKSFYVFSLEDYDRYRPQIIKLCNENNARCCLNFNRLSMKEIVPYARKLTDQFLERGKQWYRKIKYVLDTACVAYSCNNKENEYFIVDIDEHNQLEKIRDYVENLRLYVFDVPTVAGNHIVIKHWDNQRPFFDTFRDIDVSIMPYCQVLLYANVVSK